MVKRRPGRVSRKEFAAACRFDGAAVTLMTSDVLPDAVYPPTNAVTGAAEQLRLSVRSFGCLHNEDSDDGRRGCAARTGQRRASVGRPYPRRRQHAGGVRKVNGDADSQQTSAGADALHKSLGERPDA